MSFDHPYILSAFIIFIFMIAFDIFDRFKNYKHTLPDDLARKLKSSVFFFRLAMAFAIIALAGPRWGTGFTAQEYRRGLDIVFAIDVSRSMDIRDAQSGGFQSRLERGLLIAGESAAKMTGARIAAAIGRAKGFLAVPLTWDSEAALGFFESIDGASMTGRSTNLEALLQAAADAFIDSSPAQKVIVLVSDGETHSGVMRNALNRCARENIIVTTIALGSDEGRPAPAQPLLNEEQPNAPISRRDIALMRTAAERTGGICIDGSRDDAASVLSAHLLSLAQDAEPGRGKSESKERRTLFIILALIAYGASRLAPRMPRALMAPLTLFVLTLFLPSCSRGNLYLMEANYLNSRGRYDEAVIPYLEALKYEDSAPYAEYGIGLTFYSLEEGKAALKRFDNSQKMLGNFSAAEHRELRYRNSYNSGVVFFEEGDFQNAAAAFKNALRADPQRIEAKRNLELSLISITREIEDDKRSESSRQNEAREVLFDYIRQKENQHWKSREWTPEERTGGPDY